MAAATRNWARVKEAGRELKEPVAPGDLGAPEAAGWHFALGVSEDVHSPDDEAWPPVAGFCGSGFPFAFVADSSLVFAGPRMRPVPPMAGGSGDEDDEEMETLCSVPPRRLLMA